VAVTVLADGEALKPQQVYLALRHVDSGVSAYMVGKAKKGSTYLLTATPALIEKQIGKQVGVCACVCVLVCVCECVCMSVCACVCVCV
jgi:hypothetical protein